MFLRTDIFSLHVLWGCSAWHSLQCSSAWIGSYNICNHADYANRMLVILHLSSRVYLHSTALTPRCLSLTILNPSTATRKEAMRNACLRAHWMTEAPLPSLAKSKCAQLLPHLRALQVLALLCSCFTRGFSLGMEVLSHTAQSCQDA